MRQRISEKFGNRLTNLSFLCSIFVVLRHTWEPTVDVGSKTWLMWKVVLVLGDLVLPFFFFASGYLIAGHLNEQGWWKREVAKRARTLMVPFFAWSVLWLVFLFALNLIGGAPVLSNLNFGDFDWCLRAIGLEPFYHPLMGPLWYLRALFIMVCLLAPLYWLFRKCDYLVWVLLFAGYFFLTGRQGTIGYAFSSALGLGWIVFLMMGVHWRERDFDLPVSAGWVIFALGFALRITPEFVSGVYCLNQLGRLLMIVGAISSAPSFRMPKLLDGTPFLIYVLHWPILYWFAFRYYWTPESGPQWLVRASVGVFGSILLAIVIRRFSPKPLLTILTGGR